jgi:hypothetical protein
MMNSSQQDSMPPPHPKSKKDNNERKNVADDGILEGVEVEEGPIMLRDPKTGGEVEEEGQIVLRDPKTGKSVPGESTTLEEKDGSDIEKEEIVDDANDDDEDTTKDEKKDTIDEKDFEMKDIVELVGAGASGRPSRRSKINAENKMAAAVKKEESDDNDEDEDEDVDKDMMDYDNEAVQKISGKDEDEEEERNDAVVKKECEGINGDDDMVEDDDKSTRRKSRNKKRKQTKVKDSIKTENDEDWEAVEEKPKKRVRVSESVVKDAAEKMFAELVKVSLWILSY